MSASTGTVTTSDGVDIHYRCEGEGPALLLLHGLGSAGADWQPQIDALKPHYRVIAPDMRGHGLSQIVSNGYDLHQFAADALAVLDHLGVDKAHVCGLSMGGGVAFALAVDATDRVRSLCIVNSGPSARPPNLKFRLYILLRKLMARIYTPGQAAPRVAERLFPGDAQDMRQKREQFIEQLQGMDASVYRKSLYAVLRFDVADRIDRLQMPTLFLSSEWDYTPPEAKLRFVNRMPNARLEVVPETRHALPIEAPELFNRVLINFLGESGT